MKLVYIIFLVLLSTCVLGATNAETLNPRTVPVTSITTQQVADVVHNTVSAQMKELRETIVKNQDENFQILDSRIFENNKQLFRKALFGLIGALTLVNIGFAWLVNKLSKQYDLRFYEKMIDSKFAQLTKKRGYVVDSSLYTPVIAKGEIDKRYSVDQEYYDNIERKQVGEQEKIEKIKKEGPRFNKKTLISIGFFILIVIGFGIYIYIRFKGVAG